MAPYRALYSPEIPLMVATLLFLPRIIRLLLSHSLSASLPAKRAISASLLLWTLRLLPLPHLLFLFACLCLFTVRQFYKLSIPPLSLSPLFYKGFLCLCACSIQ